MMVERHHRQYASYDNLWAAAHMFQLARNTQSSGRGDSRLRDDKVLESYSRGGLLLAVASTEALVNEILSDAEEDNKIFWVEIDEDSWAKIGEGAKSLLNARTRLLDKIECVVEFGDGDAFEKGESPWQDFDHIVWFRNKLVHHKPEWIDLSEGESGRVRQLKAKCGQHPWYQNGRHPDHKELLSAGAIEWAIRSTIDLQRNIVRRLGAKLPYEGMLKEIELMLKI